MYKLSLLVICLLCLLSPCKGYLSSAAQPVIQVAPVVASKTQASTLVATFILQSLSQAMLPYIIGAAFSASAYGAYSRGGPYIYNELSINFRQKIETAKKITQATIYSSPVQNNTFLEKIALLSGAEVDLSHHQIIFQVDGLVWMLISFGIDGLEVDASVSRYHLVNRRKNNTLMAHKSVNFPTRRLRELLKQYEGHKYDILMWNCQHFVKDVWKVLSQ